MTYPYESPLLGLNVSRDYEAWSPRWGIFPIALRPSAMDAKASEWSTDPLNPLPGLKWLDDNINEKKYAIQSSAPFKGAMTVPTTPPPPPPECYFAFSTDQSMVYEAARFLGVVDAKVDESGLIGKIWAGVSLTITPMGVQSVFNLKLETVTSPNLPLGCAPCDESFGDAALALLGGCLGAVANVGCDIDLSTVDTTGNTAVGTFTHFICPCSCAAAEPTCVPLHVTAVVSEEFCLEHGTYSVETVCLPTANLQAHSPNPPYPHPSTTLHQGEGRRAALPN